MSDDKAGILKAEIVIVGGGGAGLSAALTAVEKGCRDIIILEKKKVLGGNTALAHGLFAAESPVQKLDQIIADKDELFQKAMKWDHWNRVDPRIVRAFINKSGDTIRWLQEEGVEFELKSLFANQFPRVWHWPVGVGSRLVQVLARRCKEKGVRIYLRTGGRRILRRKNGKVTGILAVNEEGSEVQINTGCVIIATGGFGGNKELLKKHCPAYYDGMYLMGLPHTGDGLLMADEAGAAIENSIPLLKEGPNPAPIRKPDPVIMGIIKEPYLVWVNRQGKRFIDEAAGFMIFESGNAILRQPDRVMYALFDDGLRQEMEEKGLLIGHGGSGHEDRERRGIPGLKDLLQKRADGEGLKMGSLDDIAGWIGADPGILKASLDEYNSFCDHGHDEVFVKNRRFLKPLRIPPFYALRGDTTYLDTMGGIKINEHMEVIDKQGGTIPGLYAVGSVADGWEGDTYCSELSGSAFGFAINSGRIAAERATEYIKAVK